MSARASDASDARNPSFAAPPYILDVAAAGVRASGSDTFDALKPGVTTPGPPTISMSHSKPRHVPQTGKTSPRRAAASEYATAARAASGSALAPPGKSTPLSWP